MFQLQNAHIDFYGKTKIRCFDTISCLLILNFTNTFHLQFLKLTYIQSNKNQGAICMSYDGRY